MNKGEQGPNPNNIQKKFFRLILFQNFKIFSPSDMEIVYLRPTTSYVRNLFLPRISHHPSFTKIIKTSTMKYETECK